MTLDGYDFDVIPGTAADVPIEAEIQQIFERLDREDGASAQE